MTKEEYEFHSKQYFPHDNLAANIPIIQYFTIQPFESRHALDHRYYVYGLYFRYHPQIVAIITNGINQYGPAVIDPAKLIFTAGGWLQKLNLLFVEMAIWPAITKDLLAAGFEVEEIPYDY